MAHETGFPLLCIVEGRGNPATAFMRPLAAPGRAYKLTFGVHKIKAKRPLSPPLRPDGEPAQDS